MKYTISAIGQDSHAFDFDKKGPIVLGGVTIECKHSFKANSDGDVIYHSLTNAISGLSTKIILGKKADLLCEKGITNSHIYVKEAIKTLHNIEIKHVSISVELKKPILLPHIDKMRDNISKLLHINISSVAITATSGEGLTAFGKGYGVQSFCIITAIKDD